MFVLFATLSALRVGVKDVMVGKGEEPPIIFRNTEIVLLLLFATTKSGFPSPSTSPIAT